MGGLGFAGLGLKVEGAADQVREEVGQGLGGWG